MAGAPTSSNEGKSLKEMTESPKGSEDSFNIDSEAANLRRELAKKEAELARHKEKLAEFEQAGEEPKIEVKAEIPEGRVEKVKERERIAKEEAEKKTQKKKVQLRAQTVKKGIADDIAVVMKLKEPKQVKALVYLALTRGIYHAFEVAKGLNDPYILDEFHGVLSHELRELLEQKGKLKTGTKKNAA